MAPASGLTGLLDSPAASHNDSTILGGGKTLPDVTLGSLGSSFRSEDEDERRYRLGKPSRRMPQLPTNDSPETSNSASITTPPPHGLAPPATVRRSSSHSALPDGTAGAGGSRHARMQRSISGASNVSDDVDGPLRARYDHDDDGDEDDAGLNTEDDNVLTALSINISPGRPNGMARTPYHGGPSKRNGRHSVAEGGHGQGAMTLRDQEQQIEQMKKDLFNLQLENHFLKDRLANTTDEHFRAMHNENVKLKLEVVNYAKEMKRLKKIILQQDKGMKELQRQLDELAEQGRGDTGLEALWQEEKERRKRLEAQLRELEEAADDQKEEVERLRDQADRAQDELDKALAEGGGGLARDMEDRLNNQIADLEDEVERLKREGGGDEELEEQLNQLQDKLAAAQLELDGRDREIDELNHELDGKVREHEKELQLVNDEWVGETAEIKAQVEELRDVLEVRDQDLKDLREVLVERDEECAIANDRVAELQANQSETHDRLEETLKNIERDNAEKDADLIAANREIETLGQRVYELEEAIDELQAREQDLNNDLQSADSAFENAKVHYENLVTALKEARRGLQGERDDALLQVRREVDGRKEDKESWQRAEERHKRALADRDQVYARLQSELDAARDRVSERDRDLASVQNALHGLENERQRAGDEHTSDRFSLELEIERVKRDLQRAEVDLDQARRDLTKRDLEVAEMMDRQRDLENRLSSERQGRLNLSDRLDEVTKMSKRHERDAHTLRDRLSEVEPLLTETQQERFQIQKQSEQQRQERSELLLRVFKDINKFLGTEDHSTPANFGVFRDTLVSRLRSMNQVRTDFERKLKETETSVESKMNGLKRQLDQKWRALDSFETSVKKLEQTRAQWRTKYAAKEGELDAAKSRNADLSRQLKSAPTSGSGGADAAQVRSLTERATSAEKRAQNAANQLALLESRLAEVQSRAGAAESKWEARVREYESRLKIAGEKIKTEKQGGKERAMQLESQVRELERQVDSAKRRNAKAEGIVATASHLLPEHR